MINLLLFLFFIACTSLAVALIVDNPGVVTMLWFDYQIETSVAFIILTILLTSILLILVTLILRRIISTPSRILQRRGVRQLKTGISELTYSVAALASSNIDVAEQHVHKVEKLLGRTPLTLLLSAQIAKSRGNEVLTQTLLEQLLEHKETEYLAARSLSDSASKQDNLPKALQLAKKAQTMNPRDNASALAVASLQVRLKHWHEALENVQKTKLPRKEKLRIYTLIQLARGELLLEDGRAEQALYLTNNILRVLPDFSPAIAFVARVYDRNNMSAKAIKLITRAWKKNPSPLFIEVLNEIIINEKPERQEKLRSAFTGNIEIGSWVCKTCGHHHEKWSLHCESCSDFNSLEWK